MTIDRDLWARRTFRIWPTWPCPNCAGQLELSKPTLQTKESAPSLSERHEPWWDAEVHLEKRFAALLICNRCREVVSVSGVGSVQEHYTEDGDDRDWFEYFTPEFFTPAPPIFRVPAKCPKLVEQEVNRAFKLYWADLGSSANALRSATECIMDDFKIAKSLGSLHNRIEAFKRKNGEAADVLKAIKWIGNDGSHSVRRLTAGNLLDGFVLFEHVLDLLYVGTAQKIKATVRMINKRKGIAPKRSSKVPF